MEMDLKTAAPKKPIFSELRILVAWLPAIFIDGECVNALPKTMMCAEGTHWLAFRALQWRPRQFRPAASVSDDRARHEEMAQP